MPTLIDVLPGTVQQAVQVQQVVDVLKGTPNKGVPVSLTATNDPLNYALTVQNDDPINSRALSILKADGTPLLTCDINGVTFGSGAMVNLPPNSVTSSQIVDGTIQAADLAAGVAAANVGTLGGVLRGTLPNPDLSNPLTVPGTLVMPAGGLIGYAPTPGARNDHISFGANDTLANAQNSQLQFVRNYDSIATVTINGAGTVAATRFTGNIAGSYIDNNTIDQAAMTTNGRLRFVGMYWAAANWSTAVINTWVATPIIQAVPNVQVNKSYLLGWMVPIQNTIATANVWVGLGWNGSPQAQVAQWTCPGSNYLNTLSGYIELAGSGVPLATNVQLYVQANAGTTIVSGATYSSLVVSEIFTA
jgi:hypothetical protein